MSRHQVEFEYKLPEFGMIEMEIEDNLNPLEKEVLALREIEDTFDDIEDINITEIKVQ